MQRTRISAPDVADFRNQTRLFEAFAFTNDVLDAALTADNVTEHARLGLVTPNFFAVLGVAPQLGRTFTTDAVGVAPVVTPGSTASAAPAELVLSQELWRSRFGGDPAVVGRTLAINGRPATVVGVMPAGFEVPMPVDVGLAQDVAAWMPIRTPLERFRRVDPLQLEDQDSDNTGAVIARLRRGVSLEQARAELEAIAARQRESVERYEALGMRIEATPFQENVVAHRRPLLLALLAGVGLVLLIASVNIANLNLARMSGRRRELAVRAALGADRWRVGRQLALESGILASLAAVADFCSPSGPCPSSCATVRPISRGRRASA